MFWLNTEAEEYFTQELRESYHKNEAQFYEDKFKKIRTLGQQLVQAVTIESVREPENADSLLSTINVSNSKTRRSNPPSVQLTPV